MASEGSVSGWLGLLKTGDEAAAQQLWERYFHRLVFLARKRLQGQPRRVADEEDVALSAFDSFCRNAQAGRFPRLADRDDLWRLLVVITARKAGHLVRDEGRLKRGGGLPAAADDMDLDQILGREPTPELAAEVADEYQRLLGELGDAELAAVAGWKMEGYSNAEIAEKLDCAPRTIERKLQLIRGMWERELAS
jgi:DNA-directed RNA polymerase specialized sigma24 family protein